MITYLECFISVITVNDGDEKIEVAFGEETCFPFVVILYGIF